eukprot:CAMPEP_0197441838 /NCGR_PEP_ID=MMETSP1175-20131217/7989_1 /TAXON_ID=1003142 /ORGANISM="Triceratium dubium, Strain CCMP147" /LENGTH=278 /DNA_ID=CAMNT_0042972177 /DNA_START=120 /DNA_END=956 /DNA_ORIENTATION=-
MSMTLLSLDPSPYSRRVVWALDLMNFEYRKEQYTGIAGEPLLRWRLGRWNPWQPVTVPLAFIHSTDNESIKEVFLENGVDIVEWANEKTIMANNPSTTQKVSLIPSSQRSELLQYCRLADGFQNFDRSMFLKALAHDPPSVLRVVAGDGPPDLALRVIGTFVGGFMRTKYHSTLQASITEIQEKAKKLEEELVEKQKRNQGSLVYLVRTDLTVADIFMCVAICGGVKDRSKQLTEHQRTFDNAVASQGFSMEEKYPALHKWAVDISEKHKVGHLLFED